MSDKGIEQERSSEFSTDSARLEDLEERHRIPIVKGCFIATAAMGSELPPHVQLLRDFRDDILLQSRYKKKFENLLDRYYQFSPPIARVMQENPLVNQILRYLLVFPIVFGIRSILPIVNIILGIEKDAIKRRKEIVFFGLVAT
jgi:hypothetical protein